MGDWVGVAIFIIVGLITVIGQILAKQREQKVPQQRPARRAAAGGQQPAGGRPVAGAGGAPPVRPRRVGNLEDEIGEFLRRAAQGRPAQPAAGRRPGPPRPGQLQPVQPKRTAPRPAQPPVTAEIVEPVARPVGGRVEAEVAEDLDTSQFRQRAGELGRQTRQSTKKVEQRLHAKFDHQLGKLTGQAGQKAGPKKKPAAAVPIVFPPTGAAGFAAMLRDVSNVRQAIILSEILTRPADRW